MPGEPYTDANAGCNWTEDGTECRLTEFGGFARAALDALTAAGWQPPREPIGYYLITEGSLPSGPYDPRDVTIVYREVTGSGEGDDHG